MNCNDIFGDSWRRRHDGLKNHLVAEATLSGIPVDCEVYGLFANILPAALHQQGGELEWGRARQGKVPDLKLLLDTPEGPQQSLTELKFVSAGKTWFSRGQAGKGTDRRAALIQGQYEATLRAYDVRFHGAEPWRRGQAEPPPGLLLRRLRGYGLVLDTVRNSSAKRVPSEWSQSRYIADIFNADIYRATPDILPIYFTKICFRTSKTCGSK